MVVVAVVETVGKGADADLVNCSADCHLLLYSAVDTGKMLHSEGES